MDTIIIENLELWTKLGAYEDGERDSEQRVLVTIEIHGDFAECARSDDIAKGIDYGKVTEDVRKLAKKERRTLERFAEDIAEAILKNYQPESVDVIIRKFILPGTDCVTLRISRP